MKAIWTAICFAARENVDNVEFDAALEENGSIQFRTAFIYAIMTDTGVAIF